MDKKVDFESKETLFTKYCHSDDDETFVFDLETDPYAPLVQIGKYELPVYLGLELTHLRPREILPRITKYVLKRYASDKKYYVKIIAALTQDYIQFSINAQLHRIRDFLMPPLDVDGVIQYFECTDDLFMNILASVEQNLMWQNRLKEADKTFNQTIVEASPTINETQTSVAHEVTQPKEVTPKYTCNFEWWSDTEFVNTTLSDHIIDYHNENPNSCVLLQEPEIKNWETTSNWNVFFKGDPPDSEY